jgi:hypothetical protein
MCQKEPLHLLSSTTVQSGSVVHLCSAASIENSKSWQRENTRLSAKFGPLRYTFVRVAVLVIDCVEVEVGGGYLNSVQSSLPDPSSWIC